LQTRKVVVLEELAAEFRLKTVDAISKVVELEASGRLSGVFDDRGNFVYITANELDAVAGFIKRRGRVSRADLAAESVRLIKLVPDPGE